MSLSRSQIHMLTVAAAMVEASGGNPKLVADLRAAAQWRANKRAEGFGSGMDTKRVDQQRTLMAMVVNGPAKSALVDAMLQRAYDLLWDGSWEGCDAICEFLPSDQVRAMMDAWNEDQEDKGPKSPWYLGKKDNPT